MHAVILAGGFGKRLRPLTDDRPKPLIEVAGKPIIEWQILHFKRYGISSFIFLTGYKWDVLAEWVSKNEKRLKISAYFSIEEEPLGTGGALKKVKEILGEQNEFIVTNGDVVTNLDFSKMDVKESVATIALVPLKSPYGIVETKDGLITSFREKPVLENYMINAGVYMMSPKIFDLLPDRGDVEKATFPKLAEAGQLKGAKFKDVYWRSIDTLKDIEEASSELPQVIPS
ncbi:nucleotidyltransferase family protein [Sulfuracidifex tepidarius]|uniref:Bifunctional protein GlmU n=1 Tax=Sulfuracidifex tepidarius TaxID=1294262 RepID=A0A510DYJ7_9CREN|nr:NDP-sugar synthase [Sulfuracidifex tepidarius]BBG25302.1 Bifunctional protein GlmU [Sulfuracidifex tepidarius]BBG28096.1 Bifunctional protein GlmU [Sulfuracidifex tepidarius]